MKPYHGYGAITLRATPARILSLVLVMTAGCTAGASESRAQAAAGKDLPRAGGIWKAAVPPKPMRGEFDNLDAYGVSVGARIKADCSLNWVSPDDGKLYCFSSGTSLEFFLYQPQATLARARARWLIMNP